MGVVFEAFDTIIERRVAIKMLRLEVFEPSQLNDVRLRFKREAQLAGQMSHPHIVTVHDYGEHDGTPFIVMEYMTGTELSRILDRGVRLPIAEVARIMNQLLTALAYAHERRVVHRDIKPGNAFVLDDGSLKVVDFGIARIEASTLTDTGALLGTPAYMSPEQFLALPVDERSDIFSAGVILYELLTGDKPFTGSVTTIMQKVLHQHPIDPSLLNPLIPSAWDAIVKRAMAKKPESRFQSARQFAETIKQVLDARAIQVSVEATLIPSEPNQIKQSKSFPAVPKVEKPPDRDKPEAADVSGSIRPLSNRGIRKTAAVALALLAVAIVGWIYTKYQQRAAELAAEERRAIENAAREAALAEITRKVAAEKEAAERLAREKLAAEQAEAARKVAEMRAAAERAAQEKREVEAARKAAEMRAAAEKAVREEQAREKARKVAEANAAEARMGCGALLDSLGSACSGADSARCHATLRRALDRCISAEKPLQCTYRFADLDNTCRSSPSDCAETARAFGASCGR
jgi:tRNA A-37 threonylcarbamoyl transferase component Bud32